ncbi:MAG: type II toxin-antitoxin system RelE/ParE family toxin [Deltaproteobacteria bacterium]|nr:type II toxin-antitoxin system RelE/ParE family toxin [Deltaproteobacteria bacterium]
MANYRIFETRQFLRDLDTLAQTGRLQLVEKLNTFIYPQLRITPHAGPNIKRLRQWSPPTWRYRVGAWRFFYTIDDGAKIISMITIGHRKEVYR